VASRTPSCGYLLLSRDLTRIAGDAAIDNRLLKALCVFFGFLSCSEDGPREFVPGIVATVSTEERGMCISKIANRHRLYDAKDLRA
jgi:hypothetical protein